MSIRTYWRVTAAKKKKTKRKNKKRKDFSSTPRSTYRPAFLFWVVRLFKGLYILFKKVNCEYFIRSRRRIREKTDARETKCKDSENVHVRKQAVRAANESTPAVTYYFILPSHVL